MPRLEVLPDRLIDAGARQSTLAGDVSAARGRLDAALGSAASAAGDAGLSGALEAVAAIWSEALGLLSASIDGLATGVDAAAHAYTVTDGAAMPGG
jgi:hypothetical protein